MAAIRNSVLPAAAAIVLALPALAAGPPTTFPTTYDTTAQVKETARASGAGRTITRRRSYESQGPTTFLDDRRILLGSLDDGEFDDFPDITATYKTNRRGVVTYRVDPASRRAMQRFFRRQIRAEGIRGSGGFTFGAGRLEFSDDGSTFEGRQTIRTWLEGTSRGVEVRVDGVDRFRFTGTIVR